MNDYPWQILIDLNNHYKENPPAYQDQDSTYIAALCDLHQRLTKIEEMLKEKEDE